MVIALVSHGFLHRTTLTQHGIWQFSVNRLIITRFYPFSQTLVNLCLIVSILLIELVLIQKVMIGHAKARQKSEKSLTLNAFFILLFLTYLDLITGAFTIEKCFYHSEIRSNQLERLIKLLCVSYAPSVR